MSIIFKILISFALSACYPLKIYLFPKETKDLMSLDMRTTLNLCVHLLLFFVTKNSAIGKAQDCLLFHFVYVIPDLNCTLFKYKIRIG